MTEEPRAFWYVAYVRLNYMTAFESTDSFGHIAEMTVKKSGDSRVIIQGECHCLRGVHD